MSTVRETCEDYILDIVDLPRFQSADCCWFNGSRLDGNWVSGVGLLEIGRLLSFRRRSTNWDITVRIPRAPRCSDAVASG